MSERNNSLVHMSSGQHLHSLSSDLNIEREVLIRMERGESPEAIAADLFQQTSLTHIEAISLFQFAFNAGLKRWAVEKSIEGLVEDKAVSWPHMTRIFFEANLLHEVGSALYQSAEKFDLVSALAAHSSFLDWHPKIPSALKNWVAQQAKAHEQLRSNLLERLAFFKEQGLLEDEKKGLGELRSMGGDSPEYQSLAHDFSERWAHHVLQSQQVEHIHLLRREEIQEKPTPQEKCLFDFWETWACETMEKLRNRSSFDRNAVDLALVFQFLGRSDLALHVLEKFPLNTYNQADFVIWFKLEILYHSRRYLECLDLLNQIETKNDDSPETMFAVSYLRAQVLWQIGQTRIAIQTIKTIVHLRPHYRSAHALLTEWTGGLG